MVAHRFRCDRSRFRLLLEDRLEEEEQSALAKHLETCDSCRLDLEQMAAASRWWGDARLLAGEASSPPPMTGPAPGKAEEVSLGFLETTEEPGQLGKLGSYEVVEVIGRGGMGVVLKAFDRPLGRFVAIKVLAPELATSATARRRFAREAQAAAAIAHEHIVAIHAVDETSGGLPYLVMQYVSGRSLQERLDQSGPPELRAVLRIGLQAASGLAAAHAVGLVHRDVKPANILLENCVERVKLTDFGLARAADDASLTQSGVVAGTPQYMAPEQARGEPVDARADLFSLGSVLYALCTGRPPFRAETMMGVLRRVCEDTPRPIREVSPEIPDWLEAIVAKLQAKDPAARFATAAEVADLFGRCLAYLEDPHQAPPFVPRRPPAPPRKAARAWVVAAALLALAITGLGATAQSEVAVMADFVATVLRLKTPDGTLVIQVDDPDVKVRIDGEDVILTGVGPRELRLSVGAHRVEMAKGGKVEQDIITITRGGKQTIKATLEADPGTSPTVAQGDASESRRGQAQRAKVFNTENQCMKCHRESPRGPSQGLSRLDPSPKGVTANIALQVHDYDVWCAVFSPDGKILVAGTTDEVVKVIDVATRREVAALDGHSGTSACAVFSPDGKIFATSGDSSIKVWDASSFKLLTRLDGHRAGVRTLAFSPDGATLASGSEDKVVKFWDVGTWKERAALPAQPQPVYSLSFAPDGRTLALGLGDWHVQVPGAIKLYDATTLRDGATLNGHALHVYNVAFSPDGTRLASTGGERRVKVWNPKYGCVLAEFKTNDIPRGLAFTPDGRLLASGINDGRIMLWDVAEQRLWAVLRGHSGIIHTVAISPDGKTLASAGSKGLVRLWELPERHTVPQGAPLDSGDARSVSPVPENSRETESPETRP